MGLPNTLKLTIFLWKNNMVLELGVLQLISVMEAWTDTLQNGVPIDVVYLDFSKAFNSVPHQRLLVKLREYGIQGKLFDWDETFLNS